jgi:hypothetical protein
MVETIKMLKGARLFTVLYNVGGNILMLVPFGFLIARIYPGARKYRWTFLYSVGFSLMIELTQYATTTRIFDIDDIIFNAMGGLIGYTCFRILYKVLPLRASKGTFPDKLSVKGIIAGAFVFALAFLCVFAYNFEKQTLSLTDIDSAYATQNKVKLLTASVENYQYMLLKKGDVITVELYGRLPMNRFVSMAASAPVETKTSSAVAGDLNYQITYQRLDKTGTISVSQKAPYVLFGYVPKVISGGEVTYDGVSFQLLYDQQYFLSVINSEVPFENGWKLVVVKIEDVEGKRWIPEFYY